MTKKQQTSARILTAASEGFRKNGYAGIGVDGIAKAAGVTSGAFYAHFGSKNGTFCAALIAGLDEVIESIPQFQKQHGLNWVQAFTEYYLSTAHRADMSGGCAMAALSPEVVRMQPDIHVIYEQKMTEITNLITYGLAGETQKDKQNRAWAMLGILIGGLTLARAVQSPKIANQIAGSIQSAAITAAGQAGFLAG